MNGAVEDMLGKLTASLYSLHLVYCCFGLFFATGLLSMFRHSTYPLVPCLMGITNLASAVCSLIILHSMVKTGEVSEEVSQSYRKIYRYVAIRIWQKHL